MLSRCLAMLLLSATLLPACESDPEENPDFPYGLDSVRDLRVIAHASTPPGAARPTLKVSADGDALCIAAGSEFAVTLPGATTAVLDPGSNDPSFCGADVPHAFIELPAGPLPTPTIVTIGDEFKTVQLDLGDLLVPREATLVAPADGVLHSGQTLEVAWAPALGIDQASAQAVLSAPGALTAIALGDAGMTATASDIPADRDDVTLTVTLGGERSVPCDGARCSTGGEWGARFPIAIRSDRAP